MKNNAKKAITVISIIFLLFTSCNIDETISEVSTQEGSSPISVVLEDMSVVYFDARGYEGLSDYDAGMKKLQELGIADAVIGSMDKKKVEEFGRSNSISVSGQNFEPGGLLSVAKMDTKEGIAMIDISSKNAKVIRERSFYFDCADYEDLDEYEAATSKLESIGFPRDEISEIEKQLIIDYFSDARVISIWADYSGSSFDTTGNFDEISFDIVIIDGDEESSK